MADENALGPPSPVGLEALYIQQAQMIGLLQELLTRPFPQEVTLAASADLVHQLDQLQGAIQEMRARALQELPTPEVTVTAPEIRGLDEALAAFSEMRDQLAKLPSDLKGALNVRVTGGGGIAASSRILDKASQTINPATEETLAQVEGHVDTLEAKLDTLITHVDGLEAALARLVPKPAMVEHASALITPVGGFQTILTFVPAQDVVVTSVQADGVGLTNFIFELRVQLDGVIKYQESIGIDKNAFTPLAFNVDNGSTVLIEVDHGEVTDRTFRASLAWHEKP